MQHHHEMSDFSDLEKVAVYRAISARRDVRSHFTDAPITDDLLMRIMDAGHHAPSVGFCQPWRFIVVRNAATREQIHASFTVENERASEAYEGDQAARYRALRLQGILSAPVNICVVSDETPRQGHGLGRRTMPQTARYSTVCAIQNMWLAARVEGVGIGWVSILDPQVVRNTLRIPEHCEIVAYLCLGYTSGFAEHPDLEEAGWEQRLPLESVVAHEYFREFPDRS